MKTLKNYTTLSSAAVLLALGMTSPLVGAGPLTKSPEQLDQKIANAQTRLEKYQAKPKRHIPAPVLANARGIVIMRNLKVGLGFGAEAGGGVAMVKEKGTDTWRPPVFVGAAEGSWGLQIGAQKSDLIILLMSEKSLDFFKPLGSAAVGVKFDAAVGPVDVGEKFDTESLKSHVLVYSDSAGAFAGAMVKVGGVIGAKQQNMTYYGASMQDVLFHDKGKITPQGQKLINAVEKFAGKRKIGRAH